MKKRLFSMIILSAIFFSFSCKTSQERLMIEKDLAYFEAIFTNGYVLYDELKKVGEIDFSTENFMKVYEKEVRRGKRKKFNDVYINDVNQRALQASIVSFLKQLNIEDSHLNVSSENYYDQIFEQKVFLTSDYYFEKIGNDYILIECPDKKLIGKKFSGDVSDLKKVIKNNMELYLFAPVSIGTRNSNTSDLFLEEKKYKVVTNVNPSIKYDNNEIIYFKATEKSLYIRAKNFKIIENSNQHKEFLNLAQEIEDKKKENIIIDLRGNIGGYPAYPRRLLASLFELPYENLLDFFNYAEWGKIRLNSPIIAEQIYKSAVEQNRSKKEINEDKQSYETALKENKRYYTGFEKVCLKELPKYEEYFSEVPNCTSRIILLTDKNTYSAAETMLFDLYMLTSNILIVGENTGGCSTYSDMLTYTLPNSKVQINLTTVSRKNTAPIKFTESWKGESYGFFPDYWVVSGNMLKTLNYLTGDNELNKIFFE